MVKKKNSTPDLSGLSANLLKRLALIMGYSCSSNKSQLVKELLEASDFTSKLAGLVASLSTNSREAYKVVNSEKRLTVREFAKLCGIKNAKAEQIISELETKCLLAPLKKRAADSDSETVYELVPDTSLFKFPESELSVCEDISVQRFLMDLVRLLQMVRQKAPRILSDGSPGVRFLSKLDSVVLSVKDAEPEYKQQFLRLLYWLSIETGLTYLDGKELKVAEQTEDFFNLPMHVRIQNLFEGWLKNNGINEYLFSSKLTLKGKAAPGLNDIPDSSRMQTARRYISENLSLLSADDRWFALSDFIAFSRTRSPDLIVKAIAEDDSINMNINYRGIFTGTKLDVHDGLPRAGNWEVVEGEFIAKTLWMLSAIGVVAFTKDLNWFNLTPQGKYCLGLAEEPAEEVYTEKCITIQPNFEVVVYPHIARPRILHLLGSFSDLVSDQESLVYRISLNSIYRAAESGIDLDEIYKFMTENSTTEIPENVSATLQEWWERCNMIFYADVADVIELSEAEPYERLPETFKKNSIKCGNYLLFPNQFHQSTSGIEVADYQERKKSCKIESDGTIYIEKKKVDIFILSYLNNFTVPIKETHTEYVVQIDETAIGKSDDYSADKILETLNEISSEVPATVAIKLMAFERELPPAKTFNIIAIALPQTIIDLGLDAKMLSKHSIGKIKEYWLITEENFNKIKGVVANLGIPIKHSGVPTVEGLNVKSVTIKDEKEKKAPARVFTNEEKLKILEKAIKRGLRIELLYELPDSNKSMIVKPVSVLVAEEDPVIEAIDDETGMAVMLTSSKIVTIKRVVRRSKKK